MRPPAGETPEPSLAAPPPYAQPAGNGRGDSGSLRLGTHRSIWAWPEVEISPALMFLVPHQQVELSPPDARRLGIEHGEAVEVVQEGARLPAVAHVRSDVPVGTAFLAVGIGEASANAFTGSTIEIQRAAAPVGAR
jgi:NADH-quinone oxidoreductase subunit G